MPLARFDKLDPERRAAILDAAGEEFAAHGFDAASINRIIAAAGISKGAIYYYFEDKVDLFVTVVDAYTTRSRLDWSHLGETHDADGFWAALHALLERSWRYTRDNPVWIGLGRAFMQIPRDQWEKGPLGAFMARHMGELSRVLAHGQTLGAIRTDLPAALLVQLSTAIGEPFDRYLFEQWDALDDAGRRALFRVGLENFQRLLLPFPSEMFDAWHPSEEDEA